jgi:hypothetical protein
VAEEGVGEFGRENLYFVPSVIEAESLEPGQGIVVFSSLGITPQL